MSVAPFYTETSKFKIPDKYLAPNLCIGCGVCDNGNVDGSSTGMIDTGKDIDWFGVVYICKNCIKEMAQVFGLLTADDYEDIANKLAQNELELTVLQRDNHNLRQIVDGYKALNLSHSDSIGATISRLESHPSVSDERTTTESSETKEAEESDGDIVSEILNSGTDASESRTDESSSSEGPADVLSVTSNDDSDSKFLDEQSLYSYWY